MRISPDREKERARLSRARFARCSRAPPSRGQAPPSRSPAPPSRPRSSRRPCRCPGTQPGEVSSSRPPIVCDNLPWGYDAQAEPAHLWVGSVMAHAASDPIFWATLAVAEQGLRRRGGPRLRRHTPQGWAWRGGRRRPMEPGLSASSDSDGVEATSAIADAPGGGLAGAPGRAAPGFEPTSNWRDPLRQRSVRDVRRQPEKARSDPTTSGRSAPMEPIELFIDPPIYAGPVTMSRTRWSETSRPDRVCLPGVDPVVVGRPDRRARGHQAAFNNAPHRYGVVERTYSEHLASPLSSTRVFEADPSQATSLPDELKQGSIQISRSDIDTAKMTAQYITRRLLVGFSVSLSRMVSYTVIIVLLPATDYAIVGPRDVPECYLPAERCRPGAGRSSKSLFAAVKYCTFQSFHLSRQA